MVASDWVKVPYRRPPCPLLDRRAKVKHQCSCRCTFYAPCSMLHACITLFSSLHISSPLLMHILSSIFHLPSFLATVQPSRLELHRTFLLLAFCSSTPSRSQRDFLPTQVATHFSLPLSTRALFTLEDSQSIVVIQKPSVLPWKDNLHTVVM